MKHDRVNQIVARVQDQRVPIPTSVASVVKEMTELELQNIAMTVFTGSTRSALRGAARLATTESNQLALFAQAGQIVPSVVRIDEDNYLHGQDATPAQIVDHIQYHADELRTKLGIAERALTAWEKSKEDKNVPIGQQLGITCAICERGHKPGDPFEMAHLYPVGDGTKEQTMNYTHRSCNRKEGQGFKG